MRIAVVSAFFLALAVPATAQDLDGAEIIVTGSRIEQDDYSDEMPAIGLRRPADFLVQTVAIRGDTRDPALRRKKIRTMLADAVRRADSAGVELAYGN